MGNWPQPYNEVMALVEQGLTIEMSCKHVGINRSTLYRKMTEIQKSELRYARAQFSKGSTGTVFEVEHKKS